MHWKHFLQSIRFWRRTTNHRHRTSNRVDFWAMTRNIARFSTGSAASEVGIYNTVEKKIIRKRGSRMTWVWRLLKTDSLDWCCVQMSRQQTNERWGEKKKTLRQGKNACQKVYLGKFMLHITPVCSFTWTTVLYAKAIRWHRQTNIMLSICWLDTPFFLLSLPKIKISSDHCFCCGAMAFVAAVAFNICG